MGYLEPSDDGLGAACLQSRGVGWIQDGVTPAFDLLVQFGAAEHVYAQAAVVELAGVRAHGLGVVSLERGPAELVRISPGYSQPKVLGGRHVGALVDVYPEGQPIKTDSRCAG